MSDSEYVLQGLIHDLAVEARKVLEKESKATLKPEKQQDKKDGSYQVTYSSFTA